MKATPILLAVSCLLTTTSCSKKEPYHEHSFPVDIAKVEKADVPVFLKAVGKLEPSQRIYVRPQVQGILTDILYEEGAFVHKGELLMTIDSRLYEANLDIAKANLSSEEADYRLHYDITRRMANLVGEDYVSEVEYEKSLTKLEASHSSIEKTHAEIKKAEVDLSYTEIYSPVNGYVGEKRYSAGNYVSSRDKHPLVIINKITPIEVQFSLPSFYLDQVRDQQKKAPLYLRADRPANLGEPLEGALEFIDNTVNSKTGMILLKGLIQNIDEKGWPGEFVRVSLLLETLQDATVVPTEAIVMGQDHDFVYVVNESTMKVSVRNIEKKHEFKTMTVITKGLKPGEIVVIDGQLNLAPGTKVHIPKGHTEK